MTLLPSHSILRGIFSAIFYTLNLLFIPIIVILLGFLNWLIPSKTWRRLAWEWLHQLTRAWLSINTTIMQISTHGRWNVEGPALDPNAWYLLISNHRSWADILVLGAVFNSKIPLLKFFLKKELLWSLAIAGLACKAVGFPFMERHTRQDIRKNPDLKSKDLETSRLACEKFKAHPCTVINFVEGTRFSDTKKQKMASPYEYLLKPKSGGLAVVLSEMHHELKGLLNVTLGYSESEFSFWNFLCGKVNKIVVHYELLPITPDLIGNYYEDRAYRAHIQSWLNDIWQLKDQKLQKLQKLHSKDFIS